MGYAKDHRGGGAVLVAAGVDIELRKQLWDYVKQLHANGTTIVLTTHYLEEAQELCDTIAIIDKGEVVACEPTQALIGRVTDKKLIIRTVWPVTPEPPVPSCTSAIS